MQVFLCYDKSEYEIDALPEEENSAKPATPVEQPGPPPVRTIWGVGYIKRKFHERKTKHEQEAPTDKAARRTADATVWIAVFTVVLAGVGAITLYEVIEGGTDTHTLAQAAKKQAGAAKALAEQAKAQTVKMDESNKKTDAIIEQATAQSKAATTSAKAAQDALTLTHDNFIIDQRPWIFTNAIMPEPNSPRDAQGHFSAGARMLWRIYSSNYGRSPAFRLRSVLRVFHGPNAMAQADAFFTALRPFPDEGGGTVLPPGGPPAPRAIVPGGEVIEVGQQYTTVVSETPLSPDDLTFIYGHDLSIVIVGRIQYRDISGKSLYWLDFCRSTFLSGAINDYSGRHNEVH